MSEHLELVEPLKKGRRVILAPKAINVGKYSKCENAALLRAAIARTIGSAVLGIDIFWDTTHTRDYARRTLSSLLGLDVPEQTDPGEPVVVTTDELTVTITVRPVGSWGGPLAVDDDIDDRLKRLQAAVTNRADHIANTLGEAPVPTISMVEIKGKKSFTGRQRASDPKFAIKVGLSRTGRWSQCVTEAPHQPSRSQGKNHRSPTAAWKS